MTKSSPRIALVYDWVTTTYGGAERILSALHQLYPQAPLFTTVATYPLPAWASNWHVHSSFLQKIPFAVSKYRWLAPLMPLAFEQLDLSGYQIIISISSAFSKGIITHPSQLHLNYLLTPPRFLYSHPKEYLSSAELFTPLKKYLKLWDQVAARRPDVTIPISTLVKERAKKYYQLDICDPLYPPITLNSTLSQPKVLEKYNLPSQYYLTVARFVKYKKVELVIKACDQLGRNLVIVGDGPEKSYLQTLAQQSSAKVLILNHLSDLELSSLYSQATAFIQPNIEDFGLAVLEAQAVGTPAILHQQSGAAELLTQKQATFISDTTVKQLVAAIKKSESKKFQTQTLINNMKKYDTTSFTNRFRTAVDQYWSEHHNR